MSTPTAQIWFLDDLDTDIDIQEDEAGVSQVRRHLVVKVHAKENIADSIFPVALGEVRDQVTFQVGAVSKTIQPGGAAAGKFICVNDGMAPIELPSEIITRRQTWEYFGPWTTAPTGWNQ